MLRLGRMLSRSVAKGIHLMVELERSLMPESGDHSPPRKSVGPSQSAKYTESLAEQPLEVLAGSSMEKRSTGQPMKDR